MLTLSLTLAIRLGDVMEKLVSPNQSDFLKGGMLVDGFVATNEVVDLAKRSTSHCFIFNVDFEKTYNLVS